MHNLSIILFLLFFVSCASDNPYDRGEFLTSQNLRHSNIPLKSGTKFTVRQGAFGKSSHNETGNQFSWDIEVPFGTPVYAAEDGMVFYAHRPDGGGGCDAKYSKSAWNVLVENGDGSVTQYTHVDGIVKQGESIKQGQMIGRTVLRGWICYPHLDYSIFKSKNHLYNSVHRKTLPIYFEGVQEGLLKEGDSYEVP